MWLLIADICGR